MTELELKELYSTVLSIAQDVSLIRDICNLANEEGNGKIGNIEPITRRSTDATNKLFKLLDELESKIKNSKEE